jgi:transposase
MSDTMPKARIPAGVVTTFELAMRFNQWAASLETPLTAERIAQHWNVSRATSYRWLRGYRDARVRVEASAA